MCKSVINAISFSGGGSSINTGVLQIAGGVAIDGTSRNVTDQSSNASVLNLSNAAINVGSGTITNNGILTIKGSGGNILSLRNSSNVQIISLANTGELVSTGDIYAVNNRYFIAGSNSSGTAGAGFNSPGNGIMTLWNANVSGFTRLNFGGTSSAEPAISKSGGELHIVYADGSTGFAGFAAGEGTKKGISVVKGGSNTPYVGLFGVDEIPQPTTAIAEATFVSGGAGSNIKTDDTFGGYTLQQITQALLDLGVLA